MEIAGGGPAQEEEDVGPTRHFQRFGRLQSPASGAQRIGRPDLPVREPVRRPTGCPADFCGRSGANVPRRHLRLQVHCRVQPPYQCLLPGIRLPPTVRSVTFILSIDFIGQCFACNQTQINR